VTNKIQAHKPRDGLFKLIALFFLVAVAVLSPPPMVTVPIIITPVPSGEIERISFPTVILPPAVRVWPATGILVIALLLVVTLVCMVDAAGVGAGKV
jgi:hypothetical protein